MKHIFTFSIIIGLIISYSCKEVNAKKGPIVDFNVAAKDYNKIELGCGGTLRYYENANDSTIVISTSQDVFDAIEVVVEDSTLIFRMKKGYSIINEEHLFLLVSAPLVKDFSLTGKGKIEVNRTTTTNLDRSELIVNGSGSIDVNQMNCDVQFILVSGRGDIEVNNLIASNTNTVLSGSGDIALFGDTDTNFLSISGTGNYISYGLNSKHSTIQISGTGSSRVSVDSTLNVNISGYGNVYYKGYPTITQMITGEGAVHDAN